MKRFSVAALAPALIVAVVGIGTAQAQTTLELAQERGWVRVGFANEAPWAYATSDGHLTGQSVEVARAVLQELGIEEMDGVLAEFGSLIPGLRAHRWDIVSAAMAILPKRCEQVDFANPDIMYGEAMAVAPGNPYDLHSYADIADNPEVRVGVMAGTTEAGWLKQKGVSDDQIVIGPDQPSIIANLRSGRVDAIVMTSGSLGYLMGQLGDSPGFERIQDFVQPVINGESVVSFGGSAFRQDDDAFRKAFNRELAELKDSGELAEIIGEFGFSAADVPAEGVTAAEICQG